MPWYKIEIHCGPGHQGTHIEYKWSSTKLDLTVEHHRDFKEEMIAAVIQENAWIDDAISYFTEVDSLPADAVAEMKERFESKIQYASKMLEILSTTKTTK